MLISGAQQSQSVIHIHIPIPFQILFQNKLSHGTQFPSVIQEVPIAHLVRVIGSLSPTHSVHSVCVNSNPVICFSPNVSPWVKNRILFSLSLSLFLSCKFCCIPSLRFHILVISHSICLSLSDFVHLVRQFRGPSMLLTGWVTVHSVCTCLLYPLLMDILELPCLLLKIGLQWAQGVHVSFGITVWEFLLLYCQLHLPSQRSSGQAVLGCALTKFLQVPCFCFLCKAWAPWPSAVQRVQAAGGSYIPPPLKTTCITISLIQPFPALPYKAASCPGPFNNPQGLGAGAAMSRGVYMSENVPGYK